MGKVVAITNQKGGVAKTTTCINLGAALAMEGKKVLLVDMDPQGNLTSGLGIDRSFLKVCVYNVLLGEAEISQVIISSEDIAGLDVVPSTLRLAAGEIEIVELPDREAQLKKTLANIRHGYDYIFLDCPPSLGLLTINALVAADSVMIPIQSEYYALEGLGHLLESIKLVERRLNPRLKIEGILLTMFDGRTNLAIQVAEEVKKHFPQELYSTVVPRNVRLSEAPSFGKPVVLYDPKCKGAQVYLDLAKEVMERD